ncbi:MAG: hypothetical protein LC745_08225 [Planctomycetia bacterium]|nr:hypothetical protein [Planctomycetia bacterium]
MRARARWVMAAGLGLLAATASAQDRERVEAEARGQAAEADRLFKAGDYAAALPLYEAERGSRAVLGDRRYEAYAVRAIGCCRSNLGDDDAAIAAWHDARKIDARRDDAGFEGYDWLLIGQAHLRRGRVAQADGRPGLAAERADDARREFASLGVKAGSAAASRALGEALADLERLDAAATALEEAARGHEDLDDVPGLARDLTLLAAVRADSGDPAGAVEVARRAARVHHDADDPSGELDALVALASYQDQAGQRADAAATLAEAVEIARREATPARFVRLLVLSAQLARRDGQSDRADALFDEAERTARRVENAALRRIVSEARTTTAKPTP